MSSSKISYGVVKALYEVLGYYDENKAVGRAAVVLNYFEAWRTLHALTVNISEEGWRAVERLAKSAGVAVGSENRRWLLLFSIETYLHLLVRLLALSKLGAPPGDVVDLRREVEGRRELFPPSPFEWVFEAVGDGALEGGLRRRLWSELDLLLEVAGKVDAAALTVDVFRELYQGVLPREIRRSLGEFYTKEGLVREVLDAAGLNCDAIRALFEEWREGRGAPRIVDPACGSGTFLVEVARSAFECLKCERGVEKFLEEALVGIDVNPFAVEMARLNMFLAISECSRSVCRSSYKPGELKVFWADSLAVYKERRNVLNADLVDVDVPALRQWLGVGTLSIPVTPELAADEVIELARECAEGGGLDRFLAEVEKAIGRRQAAALRSALEALYNVVSKTREAGNDRVVEFVKNAAVPASLIGRCAYVVGNPPWVRVHGVAEKVVEMLKERYRYYGRSSTYDPKYAKTVTPFAEQHDYSLAFVERGLEMLRAGGVLGFVITSKIAKTMYAGGLREDLVRNRRILKLVDYSLYPVPFFEDAVNYPLILAVKKEKPSEDHEVEVEVVNTAGQRRSFRIPQREMPIEVGDPKSPWILAPPEVVSAYRKIAGRSSRLGDLYEVHRGIFTSADDLYVVKLVECSGGLAEVESKSGGKFWVEPDLLHPFVRGRDIDPFEYSFSDYLIFTHDTSSYEPIWDPDQRKVLKALGLLSDKVEVGASGAALVYEVDRRALAKVLDPGGLLAGLGYSVKDVKPCAVTKCFEVLRGHNPVLRINVDKNENKVSVEGLKIPGAPQATNYFLGNLSKLVKRDDYRPRLPPWAIFRVSPKKFEDYRIAWQEIAKHFEACILPVDVPVEICGKQVSRKLVPDVTIYFIAEENPRKALRLLLYLNSDLARSLLKLRAWPSRGGYFRHESASVGFLPVPAGLLKRGVWDWVEEPPAQTAGELNEHARKVYEENKERLEKELAESLGLTDEEYRAVVDWGKWLNES